MKKLLRAGLVAIGLLLAVLAAPVSAQAPRELSHSVAMKDSSLLALVRAYDAGATVVNGRVSLSNGERFFTRLSKDTLSCQTLERLWVYLVNHGFDPADESVLTEAIDVSMMARCYVYHFDPSSPASGWWYVRDVVTGTHVTQGFRSDMTPSDIRTMVDQVRAYYFDVKPEVLVLSEQGVDVTDRLPLVVQDFEDGFWLITRCGDLFCAESVPDAFGSQWGNNLPLTLGVSEKQPKFGWATRQGRLTLRKF